MKLYHGTNQEFSRIDLLKSKPNKDFGRGFYLSVLSVLRVLIHKLIRCFPIKCVAYLIIGGNILR